jgi:parallel beta-helix repeat protein
VNDFFGVWISGTGNRVVENTANGNTDAGIFVELAGNTLTRNVTNDNQLDGISAPPGTIDGGGNTATGNGNTNCSAGIQC